MYITNLPPLAEPQSSWHAALDDFRFKHRMPTRAAAVRELLKPELTGLAVDGGSGIKSSNYGVFRRGPDGHRHGGSDSDTSG
jgi:hypothetical protein